MNQGQVTPATLETRLDQNRTPDLRRLEGRDIALNQSMIPLGSRTMKLNATAEMIPVTWPEFGQLHPFAPMNQAQGYKQLFEELQQMLEACTGYDAISLQPNAGSQGEYAGLVAIKKYFESKGETERSICLIPASAHGTNPASAQMAGMPVKVVNCDKGNRPGRKRRIQPGAKPAAQRPPYAGRYDG